MSSQETSPLFGTPDRQDEFCEMVGLLDNGLLETIFSLAAATSVLDDAISGLFAAISGLPADGDSITAIISSNSESCEKKVCFDLPAGLTDWSRCYENVLANIYG
jgi:hypothetical protein